MLYLSELGATVLSSLLVCRLHLPKVEVHESRNDGGKRGVAMASEQSTSYQPHEPAPVRTDKSIAELAEIVVLVDGRTETAGIFEFSGVLVQEHRAHPSAALRPPGPLAGPSETFASRSGIVAG